MKKTTNRLFIHSRCPLELLFVFFDCCSPGTLLRKASSVWKGPKETIVALSKAFPSHRQDLQQLATYSQMLTHLRGNIIFSSTTFSSRISLIFAIPRKLLSRQQKVLALSQRGPRFIALPVARAIWRPHVHNLALNSFNPSLTAGFPVSPSCWDLSSAMAALRGGGNSTGGNFGLTPDSFPKLCADLGSLIRSPDEEFSDLTVVVDGRKVLAHRCILAARCPGLRKVLAEMERELELGSIVRDGKVGFDAFMAVLGYVYGGIMEPWPAIVACYLSTCHHLTCRPAIDYVLEILRASLLFTLPELTTLAQEHLIDHIGEFQVDDVLHVHRSASSTTDECSRLKSACLTALASSKLDNQSLEREFSGAALEHVRKVRKELGLDLAPLSPDQEKQRKRIHRALDSDDIELVRMLLDEKKLDLDGAHALHYAAAYCHPRTLAHLLDLNLADTNARDERGMTVLHVAAWRREPHSIANVLESGANLMERTADDQTALDIAWRLTKKSSLDKVEYQKERLCVVILEQAAKADTVKVPSSAAAMLAEPTTEKELMSVLLYLENRVALARLMYPQEADIVCAHLDTYASFMSSSGSGTASRKRKPSGDVDEEPAQRLAGLVGVDVVDESKERRLESLTQRRSALRKAVEMGRKYFPSFSAVIDKYVLDDDPIDPTDENIEAQLLKKRHFAELKGILNDSFPKGKGSDDHKKAPTGDPVKTLKKPRTVLAVASSSSSTSSSRGTSDSMITKI